MTDPTIHSPLTNSPLYKRTEVGVIPEDWEVRELGTFCTTYSGGTPSTSRSDYYGGHIPWITSGDLNSRRILDVPGRITNAGLNSSSAKMVKKGDVVLALYGATAGVVARTEIDAAINQAVLAISTTLCDLEYLFQYLDNQKARIVSIYTQGGQPNLSGAIVRSILIPLPPLAEQRAIAGVLSDVDAWLAALDRLIAKKRAVKQAAMQDLLTGRVRLPGFEGEWVTRRLGDVANIKTGDKNNEDKVEDGQYPFFVRSETVERINTFSYDCEAILVPGEGKIGEIFHYIVGRFDVHQRVYAITNFATEVVGRYVFYYMKQYFGTWAMQHTVKATVDSLRLPTFQNFEMRMPKSVDEQRAIAGALSDMDAEIEALERQRGKGQALKQGLMQELLTGRIRLVKPNSSTPIS